MKFPFIRVGDRDDQTLGPLEIKTLVTERLCIRNIVVSVAGCVAFMVIALLPPHTNLFRDAKLAVYCVVVLTQTFQWAQSYRRVRREGPFEISSPNRKATPAQRRFEREFWRAFRISAFILFGATFSSIFLLQRSSERMGAVTLPLVFLTALVLVPMCIYLGVKRRRLAADAIRQIEAAKHSLGSDEQALGYTTYGHWWTQSALRNDNLPPQQVGR